MNIENVSKEQKCNDANRVLECVNLLEKDEYGLYKKAKNYHLVRDNIMAFNKHIDKEKLNRVPKFIRWFFNAL